MQNAEPRIAFIVRGVVEQAMRDAGATCARLLNGAGPQGQLFRRWCDVATCDDDVATLITLAPANKTQLLLGRSERADVYPLGDLYASEIESFAGSFELSQDVQEVAELAGGVAPLDQALRGLLDERRQPEEAFAHAPRALPVVIRKLEQNRFYRMQAGIVPKIGARTLGIDLFI